MRYLFITNENTDFAYNTFQMLAKYISKEHDVSFVHRAKKDNISKKKNGFHSYFSLKPVLEKQSHFTNIIIALQMVLIIAYHIIFRRINYLVITDRYGLIASLLSNIFQTKIILWKFEYTNPKILKIKPVWRFIIRKLYLYIDVDQKRLEKFCQDWSFRKQTFVFPNTTIKRIELVNDQETTLNILGLPSNAKFIIYSGGILRQSLGLIYESFRNVNNNSIYLIMFLSASQREIEKERNKINTLKLEKMVKIFDPVTRDRLHTIMKLANAAIMFVKCDCFSKTGFKLKYE